MRFFEEKAGKVDIAEWLLIAIGIVFALALIGTVVTSTDSTSKNHDYLNYAVTDEQVNYTSLGDTAIALTYGGTNQDVTGTPIVENTTGFAFVSDSGNNYTIDKTAGTINVNSSGMMFNASFSSNNMTNITYNYTAWTPPTLASYSSAQNIAKLFPFLFIIIPVLAVVFVITG